MLVMSAQWFEYSDNPHAAHLRIETNGEYGPTIWAEIHDEVAGTVAWSRALPFDTLNGYVKLKIGL